MCLLLADDKTNDDPFRFGRAVQLRSLRKPSTALNIAAVDVVGVGDEPNERQVFIIRLRFGKRMHQFRLDHFLWKRKQMICDVRRSRPDLPDPSCVQLFVERSDLGIACANNGVFTLDGITQSRCRRRFHKSLWR